MTRQNTRTRVSDLDLYLTFMGDLKIKVAATATFRDHLQILAILFLSRCNDLQKVAYQKFRFLIMRNAFQFLLQNDYLLSV